MTIGDVLAAIAAVFTIGATWAATLLLAALAFPQRAERAERALTSRPWACLARGAGTLLVFGLIALGLVSQAAGPVRLIGWAVLAALGALAALGGAGAVRLIGERIQKTGAIMSPFASLTRGAILYVAAGFLPVIGWFLVAPVALLMSLGAGLARDTENKRAAQSVAHPAPTAEVAA